MNDLSPTIIVATISLVAAPVAAGVNWLLNRRSNDAKHQSESVAAAHEAVQSLREALREATNENERLRREIERLRDDEEGED